MKKFMLLGAALFASTAMAQDNVARVVNVQPRFVTVYQQECNTELVRSDNSGVGTVIGGVAGGIIGNQVGGGSGKDVATVLGAIVGAKTGERIGRDQVEYRERQFCYQVPQQRQVGEIVTFEYQGRRFMVQFDK
jgi:uncharacterized protein YcfJ